MLETGAVYPAQAISQSDKNDKKKGYVRSAGRLVVMRLLEPYTLGLDFAASAGLGCAASQAEIPGKANLVFSEEVRP